MRLFSLKIITPLICVIFAGACAFFYFHTENAIPAPVTSGPTSIPITEQLPSGGIEQTGASGSHIFQAGEQVTTDTSLTDSQNAAPSNGSQIQPTENPPAPNDTIVSTQLTNDPAQTESSLQKSLHTYANAAAPSIINLYAFEHANFETFAKLASSTPPTNISADVIAIAQAHEGAAAALESITLPTELATYHTAAINGYKTAAVGLRQLAEASTRGVTSFPIFQNYNQAALASAQALVAIGATLKKDGVKIAPNEPGYFFLNLIP